jgi:hypothetical protein
MNLCVAASATKLDVYRLISAAVAAPSPDNNQPWLFAPVGDRLGVWLDRERALPSDVHGMFDLMAIGSAIENIVIAATEVGFEAEVRLEVTAMLGSGNQPVLAGTIGFRPGGTLDPLQKYLFARCTCRGLYSRNVPRAASLEAMTAAASKFNRVQVTWVTDRPRLRRLALLIARTDLLRFAYQPFHEELFRQLRFTPAEAETKCDGLDLRTLGIPPGCNLLLCALRPWQRMKWLHRLRLGWLLVVPSVLAVIQSGALGVLTIDTASSSRFIEGGRAFQRLWLEAERQGLSLQPLGSPAIFFAHCQLLVCQKLPSAHRRLLPRVINQFEHLVPELAGRTLLMTFRVGHAKGPAFRSLRRPVQAVFKPANWPGCQVEQQLQS